VSHPNYGSTIIQYYSRSEEITSTCVYFLRKLFSHFMAISKPFIRELLSDEPVSAR
jgi:hypothetical protein